MTAEFWVAASFVVFMAILYKVGAFGSLVRSLDHRSAQIREELEEAKTLRAEAQRVLADFQRKRVEAEAEAASIVANAKLDAERLASEAEAKLADFVTRRTAMAEQRIAQAEAQATADVRSAAAEAAVKASETILRKGLAADGGASMLTQALGEVKAKLN